MRSTGWTALALCASIASACGPNAARVTLDAPGTPITQPAVTPVPWRIEPTPTLGRPTSTAIALPQPRPTPAGGFAPTVVPPATPTGAARLQTADPRSTVAPTVGVPHAPFP